MVYYPSPPSFYDTQITQTIEDQPMPKEMRMNEKHTWYDVIVSWASGKEIQFKHRGDQEWVDVLYDDETDAPNFNIPGWEWRVKPNGAVDQPRRLAVLEKATAIVSGAREATYGGPEQSFRTIADLWAVYLGRAVAPHDVAAMLALLKLARLKHSNGNHEDSWVDLAGYAACGAECVEQRPCTMN